MEQHKITLDAHALIWYVHEPSKSDLSAQALETIKAAEHAVCIAEEKLR